MTIGKHARKTFDNGALIVNARIRQSNDRVKLLMSYHTMPSIVEHMNSEMNTSNKI